MNHPIFSDPPSRDMTVAQQRQQALDAQIEAFLAKGGKIQAFDQLRRPVEPVPWSTFTINPRKTQVTQSVEPPASVCEAPTHTPKPKRSPRPRRAAPDEEQLAVKIMVEAALGGSPRVIAQNLRIPLNRCQAIAQQYHVQFHG